MGGRNEEPPPLPELRELRRRTMGSLVTATPAPAPAVASSPSHCNRAPARLLRSQIHWKPPPPQSGRAARLLPTQAFQIRASSTGGLQGRRSSLESLFCYDKAVPEERIETPVGLSLEGKDVRGNPPCSGCQTKGAVLCATCSGSGLYVDSILESQGIIVKVRCLGCGGTGNIMCSECGGRGHL